LDEEAASEERVPEEGVAEARKELAERLSEFAGLTYKYEKLTVLRPRPMTLGVLRLDGAPNQRGAEIDRVAAKFGVSIEHPVPHDHRSMGEIEGYHSGDLKAGMASLHDAGAPIFMWCFFMENARNADNYVPRRDEKISPYALAHSHVELKRNALALRCKRAGCLAYCHISQEVRTKMGLRRCAAILLSEAIFSGYAGYWFLSIGTAVLFVCD
jgi:hypothetical protein